MQAAAASKSSIGCSLVERPLGSPAAPGYPISSATAYEGKAEVKSAENTKIATSENGPKETVTAKEDLGSGLDISFLA